MSGERPSPFFAHGSVPISGDATRAHRLPELIVPIGLITGQACTGTRDRVALSEQGIVIATGAAAACHGASPDPRYQSARADNSLRTARVTPRLHRANETDSGSASIRERVCRDV